MKETHYRGVEGRGTEGLRVKSYTDAGDFPHVLKSVRLHPHCWFSLEKWTFSTILDFWSWHRNLERSKCPFEFLHISEFFHMKIWRPSKGHMFSTWSYVSSHRLDEDHSWCYLLPSDSETETQFSVKLHNTLKSHIHTMCLHTQHQLDKQAHNSKQWLNTILTRMRWDLQRTSAADNRSCGSDSLL